jgi:ribonuclease D
LIALSEALVRARAASAGLAYELLATRADLQRIVTAVRSDDGSASDAEVRTLQGWRREVVGSELLDLLAGRRSLRVGPGLEVHVDG